MTAGQQQSSNTPLCLQHGQLQHMRAYLHMSLQHMRVICKVH